MLSATTNISLCDFENEKKANFQSIGTAILVNSIGTNNKFIKIIIKHEKGNRKTNGWISIENEWSK